MTSDPLFGAPSAFEPGPGGFAARADAGGRAGAGAITLSRRPVSISVVICVYTEARWEEIRAAVASVGAQLLPALECLLVVDHNPALAERARRELSGCAVIESEGPKGLSGARNTGTAHARGEVVAFLDDDARAAPDWLARLAEAYERPEVVAAGGLVIPDWVDSRPGWFPPEFDWVVGCSHSGMPRAPEAVRNLIGANMSLRRDVLVEVGGFAEALGRSGANTAGCEETELCIRATATRPDATVLYDPGAVVRHKVPPSRGTWSYFLRRCLGEGRSKALVTSRAGSEKGLAAERAYLRSTIPLGVVRSLGEAVHGRRSAALRAVALLAGVGATAGGYAAAHFSRIRAVAVGMLGPLVAFALWILALTSPVHLDKMTDFGLLSVLPRAYFVAIGILCASFVVQVALRRTSALVLGAHVAVLLLMFHATPTLLYHTLRYQWAWKHVAIIDYVILHHGVNLFQHNKLLVAYQDWPGFFSLNGMVTNGSGFTSALSYASWAPFVNEALYAGPLWMIFRELTTDRRVLWSALWIFYLGNWIGQDYFSPQGFAFFLYLVVIALVFSRLMRPSAPSRRGRARRVRLGGDVEVPPIATARPPLGRGELVSVGAVVVLCMVAIASSHQLTPFMVVGALVALWLFRRLRSRWLAAASIVIAVGWIALAARQFMAYNLPSLTQGIGHFFSNATVNEYNAGQASPDQLLIGHVDRAFTALVIVLGVLGILRRWRQGRLRPLLPALLLVIVPGAALGANNYGGEVVFRVYLFALPFLAFFGATLFESTGRAALAWFRNLARAAVAFFLLGGFLVSYYGKERSNYFPPKEVQAVEAFYHQAPPGSLVITADGNIPWPLEGYNTYRNYLFATGTKASVRQIVRHPVRTLSLDLSGPEPSYLVFATSDAYSVEMTGALPKGAYRRIEAAVLASPRFRVVLSNPYVVVVTRPGATKSAPPVVAGAGGVRGARR
ncbi:MAG: glycosyltransferase family 2 protein [Actinomycetota bacterium]|nr:glycosyltransferase family 2 protein [Actinomycetota bacterium]